nr:B66 [uncultured bacterium]
MKINAKYVVFSVITVTSLYVLYHNERFIVEPSNPIWQHYEPFKWWLLPHALFGTIVLLFAPLQFSDRLRQRFTKSHRIMGRLYVVGAFILAPLGAYIQYYQERMGAPRSFTILAIVDAVMLVSATALAFLFAVKRKIALHRQWATRSYAIALVFIAGRFVLGITGWELLGVEIAQAIIWSCLALSMVLADVSIHWREIVAALSPAKQHVKRTETIPARAVRAA